MKEALIIQMEGEDREIGFSRDQLEELLRIPNPPIQGDSGADYRCRVCGVPMAESFSEGRYVNASLETDRWEEYHGIQAMNGYPSHCIIYNDTFGWQEHEPEEV